MKEKNDKRIKIYKWKKKKDGWIWKEMKKSEKKDEEREKKQKTKKKTESSRKR